MVKFNLRFKKSALKELQQLPKIDIARIIAHIEALATQPFPLESRKLTGQNYYRLRQGNYRVIYQVLKKELVIEIIKIAHRKNVYTLLH